MTATIHELHLTWAGPYAAPGFEHHSGFQRLPKQTGNYLRTFQRGDGYEVYSPGITTKQKFLKRWRQNRRLIRAGHYPIIDPDQAQNGVYSVLWPGAASKALHFLCRALGYEQKPPVPIDGKVIRARVWPRFRQRIPLELRPDDWEGNGFSAYSRYMTAIIAWADARNWTTPQTESTIFSE